MPIDALLATFRTQLVHSKITVIRISLLLAMNLPCIFNLLNSSSFHTKGRRRKKKIEVTNLKSNFEKFCCNQYLKISNYSRYSKYRVEYSSLEPHFRFYFHFSLIRLLLQNLNLNPSPTGVESTFLLSLSSLLLKIRKREKRNRGGKLISKRYFILSLICCIRSHVTQQNEQ